jgi:RNA polymerase sigma factor (sigma-70 family)
VQRGYDTRTSRYTCLAALCLLILLCSVSPYSSAVITLWAARTASSTPIGATADFISTRQMSDRLEGVPYVPMTRDEFNSALKTLARSPARLIKVASRLLPLHDAQDVSQDVLLDMTKLPDERIQSLRNLFGYAATAIRHRALDLIKYRQRRPKHDDVTDPKFDGAIQKAADDLGWRVKDPCELLEWAQHEKILQEAMNKLNPLERDVLREMSLEGNTAPKVALRLGVTVHRVRGAWERGLNKLTDTGNALLRDRHTKKDNDDAK